MSTPATSARFLKANPHALATILEASQTKSIISSKDIFDISGTKLWARNQPVSDALQRKLLDRQLREPLETCLLAEDGVTSYSLLEDSEVLLQRDTPLAHMLKPYTQRLLLEIKHLPLHAVVQLLLTAAQASKPQSFEHALLAMLLNGSLAMAHGASTPNVRLAMLAGLMHDLGELYIAPEHGELDADRDLSFESYQHLVVHPHVGQLLITQLTNYPANVARAIAEHHERLDGSGYPHCLMGDAISPLGKLTAVTEAALNSMRQPRSQLAHASVALRVVPGEFDLTWVGFISQTVRTQPPLQAQLEISEIAYRWQALDHALQAAERSTEALHQSAQSAALKDAMGLAEHLLSRLRTGWNASGLWSQQDMTEQDVAELEAVEAELLFRLRGIQRAALLRAGTLTGDDAERVTQWGQALAALRN
jgi:HD-GYP domain-containing protein (c-di-GMP phosphodiesterase class II)